MSIEQTSSAPKYIVEVGFGDGKKIGRLALENPSNIYIGLEVPIPQDHSNKVDSALPNLSLKYIEGFEGLSQMPEKSISIIMMDLVLEEDFTLTESQWRPFFPRSTVKQIRQSDVPYRERSLFVEEAFDIWRTIFLCTAKRALKDDGELHIHTYRQDLPRVTELLKNTGFIFESKKSTPEETSKSRYMRGVSEKIEERHPLFDSRDSVYTVIARKDLSQKEIKLLTSP